MNDLKNAINKDKRILSMFLLGFYSIIISIIIELITLNIFDRLFIFPKFLSILGLSAMVFSLILLIININKEERKRLDNKIYKLMANKRAKL